MDGDIPEYGELLPPSAAQDFYDRAYRDPRFGLQREDNQKIILEAIQIAARISDPSAMIRGVNELNKMYGYHAPERKQVTVNGAARRIQRELEALPDSVLLEIAGGALSDE